MSSSKVVTTMKVIGAVMGKSSLQGAQTTIHAALASASASEAAELNGKYLSDCREERWLVAKNVGDRGFEEKLWLKTEKMLKIDFKF